MLVCRGYPASRGKEVQGTRRGWWPDVDVGTSFIKGLKMWRWIQIPKGQRAGSRGPRQYPRRPLRNKDFGWRPRKRNLKGVKKGEFQEWCCPRPETAAVTGYGGESMWVGDSEDTGDFCESDTVIGKELRLWGLKVNDWNCWGRSGRWEGGTGPSRRSAREKRKARQWYLAEEVFLKIWCFLQTHRAGSRGTREMEDVREKGLIEDKRTGPAALNRTCKRRTPSKSDFWHWRTSASEQRWHSLCLLSSRPTQGLSIGFIVSEISYREFHTNTVRCGLHQRLFQNSAVSKERVKTGD